MIIAFIWRKEHDQHDCVHLLPLLGSGLKMERKARNPRIVDSRDDKLKMERKCKQEKGQQVRGRLKTPGLKIPKQRWKVPSAHEEQRRREPRPRKLETATHAGLDHCRMDTGRTKNKQGREEGEKERRGKTTRLSPSHLPRSRPPSCRTTQPPPRDSDTTAEVGHRDGPDFRSSGPARWQSALN